MSHNLVLLYSFCCWTVIYCCMKTSQPNAHQNELNMTSDPIKHKTKPISKSKPSTKDINSLSTIEDYLEYYGIDKSSISSAEGVAPRWRSSSSEVTELPMALCALENTTVALENTTVALEIPEEEEEFFPKCVRVPRCKGRCNLPKYECLPLATETIKVKIAKLSKQQKGSRRRRNAKLVSVDVVIHTQCDCGCKKMEESCNSDIHNYNKDSCNCQCKNIDEEDKCLYKGTHKWINEKCACECHNSRSCSSGYYYDHSSCSCQLG